MAGNDRYTLCLQNHMLGIPIIPVVSIVFSVIPVYNPNIGVLRIHLTVTVFGSPNVYICS